MDDIQERLKETSQNCISSYEKWAGNKKDRPSAESLQEAIHELRKVSSRLEIELAISERDEMALKPIPIPPHRASRKGAQGSDEDFEMPDSNNGNYDPQAQQSRGPRPQHGQGGGPRRLPNRNNRPQGGGGQGGGQSQGQ